MASLDGPYVLRIATLPPVIFPHPPPPNVQMALGTCRQRPIGPPPVLDVGARRRTDVQLYGRDYRERRRLRRPDHRS